MSVEQSKGFNILKSSVSDTTYCYMIFFLNTKDTGSANKPTGSSSANKRYHHHYYPSDKILNHVQQQDINA